MTAAAILVDVHRPAMWAWSRAARRHYPREAFGYLLGTTSPKAGVVITDIWIPRDLRRHSHTSHVEVPHHWFVQATDRAQEDGLQVVGCIHSHPDDEYDGCPSRSDLTDISRAIWAISIIQKRNERPHLVRTDWYGPVASVAVTYFRSA